MIKIIKKKCIGGSYYDFIIVKGDSGQFVASAIVNGEPYILREGDTMDFKISNKPKGEPLLTIVADSENRFNITTADSETLNIGNYYCDVTLNYANGNRDTFIKIPTSGGNAISNFHVTYGV